MYGGSFNPVHLAHVMVPMHLSLNDPSIDKIIVMVCYNQHGKSLAPFEHRFEMCKLAFAGVPRVEVSDLEREMGGESITLRTVRELKKRNPDWSIRFILGSDLVERAPNWEGWNELIQEAQPLIVGRAGIVSPNGPPPISPAISSTEIREGLAHRDWKSIERFLPSDVFQYLRKHERELYVPEGVK
jgi:nicotinate-nucleotide adenylyltransferase